MAVAVTTLTGAQVEPAGHTCVARVTVLETKRWWRAGNVGRAKRPESVAEEVGWVSGGGPRLTWQEGPR